MSAARCAAAVLAAALLAAPGAPARDRAGDVGGWVELELDAIAAHRVNPPRAARALALASVAMQEAAKAPARQRRSAVDGAATAVLASLFPDRAAAFEAHAARPRSRRGWTRGRRAGDRVLARARRDGSEAVWQGTAPTGPGVWTPTPPAFAPALEPLAGSWRTWNIGPASRFRPGPPPPVGGPAWTRELHEVHAVSRALTADQRRVAEHWADGPGTVSPPGHWNAIALGLIRRHDLPLRAAARVLAAMNTAQADAFIACWDAKYRFWSERPVTAIRHEIDPGWLPLLPTPPFPSYVSGHSSTSGAASVVLASSFPAAARNLRAMAAEAAASRLYGGIHFRSDNEAGLTLGRAIGGVAVRRWELRSTVGAR